MLEDRLAIWDDAEASLAFASGMAAISTTLWAYMRPSDIIVHSQPIYGGAETLLRSLLPEFGVNHIVIRTHWAGMPLSTALSSMRLISEELLPALQKV